MSPWQIDSFTAGGVNGNGKIDHVGWLKNNQDGLHIMIQIGYQATEEDARAYFQKIAKSFGA